MVKKIKSYVKDTTDFIKKIEARDHITDDSYLVSLDVRSLYTNHVDTRRCFNVDRTSYRRWKDVVCLRGPDKEGIEAVKQKLQKSKPRFSVKFFLT